MRAVHPRVSYADLERAPEGGRRYELYDGEVFVVPAPLPRHQITHRRLVQTLLSHIDTIGGVLIYAPLDVVFSDYDVLQPDIVYFRPERAHLVDLDRAVRDPPDLCVEVLSPSTEATDRGKKMQMFARHGVAEYWIVDPRGTIEVFELGEGRYVLRLTASGDTLVASRALPGWSIRAATIFP